MAQYFSLLDWIGGTLYVPKGQETLDFGLSEGVDPELKTVWNLYWIPFKRAFGLLFGWYAPPTNTPAPQAAKSVGA
jgi:hypothetical protein